MLTTGIAFVGGGGGGGVETTFFFFDYLRCVSSEVVAINRNKKNMFSYFHVWLTFMLFVFRCSAC